ncbi:hypothetical protein LIER_37488 [Lithospermum erythrorhizon]|uniref:Uncharacterized protein n=1 Tax=Lithospermum erythrorhizon TaxID=34254 RepID=A0AAV3PMD5_LITER
MNKGCSSTWTYWRRNGLLLSAGWHGYGVLEVGPESSRRSPVGQQHRYDGISRGCLAGKRGRGPHSLTEQQGRLRWQRPSLPQPSSSPSPSRKDLRGSC